MNKKWIPENNETVLKLKWSTGGFYTAEEPFSDQNPDDVINFLCDVIFKQSDKKKINELCRLLNEDFNARIRQLDMMR